MEAWATVVIVLVSNAIIGAVSVLTVRKQLKHSAEKFKMELKAKKEADTHERQREVRDEHLVNLRDELAGMTRRLEFAVHLVTQVSGKVTPGADKIKIKKALGEAVEEWDVYLKSGVFFETLHMQYDHDLKLEAHKIFGDYQSAYFGISDFWGSEKAGEAINKAEAVIKENARRVSEIQLRIVEMREKL